MAELHEVVTEPNQDLIGWIRKLLEAAEAGHIRGLAATWVGPSDHVSHGWITEGGIATRLILAEMMIAQTDMAAARGLAEHDSFLAEYLGGEL